MHRLASGWGSLLDPPRFKSPSHTSLLPPRLEHNSFAELLPVLRNLERGMRDVSLVLPRVVAFAPHRFNLLCGLTMSFDDFQDAVFPQGLNFLPVLDFGNKAP